MSITTDNIPPEVVEAAAIEMAGYPWKIYPEAGKDYYRNKARAAIATALAAWPGAVFAIEANNAPCVLLLLPPEKGGE